jgi:hypothetical protein
VRRKRLRRASRRIGLYCNPAVQVRRKPRLLPRSDGALVYQKGLPRSLSLEIPLINAEQALGGDDEVEVIAV